MWAKVGWQITTLRLGMSARDGSTPPRVFANLCYFIRAKEVFDKLFSLSLLSAIQSLVERRQTEVYRPSICKGCLTKHVVSMASRSI